MTTPSTIALRIEGGLGDHILGLRLLPFIKTRYPNAKVTIYSDAGGAIEQLEVLRMSPYASEIVPVLKRKPLPRPGTWWHIDNVEPTALSAMRGGDLFLDGCLWEMYVSVARCLGMPFLPIVSTVPKLRVPEVSRTAANSILNEIGDETSRYVGLNLAKYGAKFLLLHEGAIRRLIDSVLEWDSVKVLNFCKRAVSFQHWPDHRRIVREGFALSEVEVLLSFGCWDKRIINIQDVPIPVVAALLDRCSYFIGVDNGIKHLAWALGVPHSLILPRPFDLVNPTGRDFRHVLMWMPDIDRGILLENRVRLDAHLREAASLARFK